MKNKLVEALVAVGDVAEAHGFCGYMTQRKPNTRKITFCLHSKDEDGVCRHHGESGNTVAAKASQETNIA